MKNLRQLHAGDTASWHDDPLTLDCVRYTSQDWVLTYQLRGPTQLTLQAVGESDGWRTSISLEQSQALQAGSYLWASHLSRAGERKTVASGGLVVQADLAAITDVVDGRSMAEKALADCEAALATFKSSGGKVKSYTIGSRTTEYHSLADLMTVRRFWQRRVQAEKRNKRQLLVRFG